MRYFIELSYDGTPFVGWQRQPSGDSVQSCLEDALSILFRKPLSIVGAGRTDAGVHVHQLYAHVDRIGIRNKGSNKTEYKADYADCINNLEETEIVIPEYDTNGNPIRSSKPKDNEEYILFPKARDKEYEKINFKDY